MEAIVAAFLAIIGLAVGAAAAWFLRGREIAGERERAARAEATCTALAAALRDEQAARTAAEEKAATQAQAHQEEVAKATRLEERVRALESQFSEKTREVQSVEERRIAVETANNQANQELAKLKERLEQFNNLEVRLRIEFENIANRILAASSSNLSETSRNELNAILAPLRERLQDFQNKIDTTYDSEKRDVLSLKEQIRNLLETSNSVGQQADSLAKALRGDSQVLGHWGDIQLERILEAAGMQEGREYISQGRGLALRNDEGTLQRPDIVVLLPQGRSMVIDSKAPLTAYDRLLRTSDEEERKSFGRHLVRDLKSHIDDLSGKKYQDNEKLMAHDCVMMFVVIEGALAAALTVDREIFLYAWERRVVLVGPSGLLMTMQTVHSIWQYEQTEQNAKEIARLAGQLLDKIHMSLDDLNAAREKMSDAITAHDEAVKRFSTGKGNALSIGGRIKILGAKTKHPVPELLIEGGKITTAIDDPIEEISQTGSDIAIAMPD